MNAAPSSIFQALLKFQGLGLHIEKDATNPHFKNKYPSLDSLMGIVLPAMNKCGLVLLQLPTYADGNPGLTTRIVHAPTGEFVESTMLLAMDKLTPQAQGSALTYARRYSLMAFLGLVADDDTDGQAPKRPPAGSSEGTGGSSDGGSGGSTSQGSAAAPEDTKSTRDPRFASEAQSRRLFAIAKANNVSNQTLKLIIERVTGQGSTAQIPREQYDAVCEAVTEPIPDDVPF